MKLRIVLTIVFLSAVACSRSDDDAVSTVSEDSSRDSSAQLEHELAGHSQTAGGVVPEANPQHPTNPSTQRGMDHGEMAAPAPGGHADHGAMAVPEPPRTGRQSMDHADMSSTSAPNARDRSSIEHAEHAAPLLPDGTAPGGVEGQQSAPGMAHSAAHPAEITEPAVLQGDAAATDKLRQLVALLVEEPAVEARIRADPTLRTLWDDHAVRAFFGGRH